MSDKYPSDSGRRRFVKGVVGSAALSGVGVGGAATVNLATQPAGGGDTLNVEHFSDYETWGNEFGRDGVGKPAKATWRSDDVAEDEIVPVTVIRSKLIEEKAQRDDEVGQWYSAASSRGVIAYMNVCTHFCCVPGYKFSESAAQFDIEDGVYCQCHQSQYDPFTPEFDTFVSLPRPD